MIASPYFWLGLLIGVLIVFGSGYDLGAKHAREHAAAEQLEAVAQARIEAAEQAKADQQTAQAYEAARETVRTVYVKIKEKAHENIENHPEYDRCQLDADGLRLYNAHPGAAETPAPGADRALSRFADVSGWETIDDFAKQPGTLATVLRLPSAAQSAVAMGATAAGETGIKRADR